MRRHTGARPYHCGVCPARFIQSGQLKAHRASTGHWMETQPDLKGGHRVEPVVPLTNPTPIKFKKHGKKPTKLEELDETKPQVFSGNLIVQQETDQPLLVESSKLLEQLQEGAIENFEVIETTRDDEERNVEEKNGLEYGLNNLKFECKGEVETTGQKVSTEDVTFQTNFSTDTTSGSFSNTDDFNYQNYG